MLPPCLSAAVLFFFMSARNIAAHNGGPTLPATPQQVHLFTPGVVEANLTQNMVRTAGRAVKTAAPVLVGEQPWEQSLFFYHSVIQVGPEVWLYYASWTEHGAFVCMAQSADGGRTFSKKDLHAVQYGNSTANNIVLVLTTGTELVTFGAVFVDDAPSADADARFKMTVEHAGNTGMDVWASEDGIHGWHLLVPKVQASWFADTQPVVYWDSTQKEYLAYGRLHAGTPPGTGKLRACPSGGPASMRQVGFSKTVDGNLSDWTPVKEIFGFDDEPACVDIYNSAAVRSNNAYFMLPSEYRHFDPSLSHACSPGNDGILDIRLAVSSDGEQFEWVSEETFVDRGVGALTPTETGSGWHYHGDWDSGIIFAVRGFVQDNSTLTLFYWGTQMTHGDYPKIWEYRNAAASGIGRLTLRKDGWFSFDSGSLLGILTTTPVLVPAKLPLAQSEPAVEAEDMKLVVLFNLLSSVRGVVRAELLDGVTARPLAGYSFNDSVALIGHNALRVPLQWRSGSSRPAEQLGEGRLVRLRIEATFTKLFTFELAWQPPPPPPPPPPVVTRAPAFGIDIIDPEHGAYNHSYPPTPFANKTLGVRGVDDFAFGLTRGTLMAVPSIESGTAISVLLGPVAS